MTEWTVETLKILLDDRITALELRLDNVRVEDIRARTLTEGRMNDKFEEHNKFRQQLEHERASYVGREEMNSFKASMGQELNAVRSQLSDFKEATNKALDTREGQSKGIGITSQTVFSLIFAAAAMVAIAVAFIK